MKTRHGGRWIGLGWVLLPALLAAAPEEALEPGPPPPPPFHREAPDYAAWTEKMEETKSDAPLKAGAGSKTLVELDVSKSPGRRREASRWSDGTVSENWVFDGLLLMQSPVGGWINISSVAQATGDEADFARNDFSELLWLSAGKYAGKGRRDGRECHVFRSEGREAWIDVQTGLPLAYRDGAGTRVYGFGPGPGSPLALPDAFRPRWEAYTAALKAADVSKMPPPPP